MPKKGRKAKGDLWILGVMGTLKLLKDGMTVLLLQLEVMRMVCSQQEVQRDG